MYNLLIKQPSEILMNKQYYQRFEDIIKNHPQCHLAQNVQVFNHLDFKMMSEKDPLLFQAFTRGMTDKPSEENKAYFEHYMKAYQEIKKEGLFKNKKKTYLVDAVKALKEKVDGDFLIPTQDIIGIVTEKKKRGIVSLQFDYHAFIDLIEKYYQIQTRGFFDSLEEEVKHGLYHRYVTTDPKELKLILKSKVSDNYKAGKVSIIHEYLNEAVPYVDFWHDLLDKDFCEISNGSIASIYRHEDDAIEYSKMTLEEQVCSLIREIIFKEASTLPFYTEQPEDIEFEIYW